MITGGIYAAEVLPVEVLNIDGKMGRSAAVGTCPCSCGLVTRLVGRGGWMTGGRSRAASSQLGFTWEVRASTLTTPVLACWSSRDVD
jgi:hypothetical protein